MKRITILFLLFTQYTFGQYFVVKDKDGYVNIREKENVKSKILGTLPNDKLVYIFHADEDISNWHYVDKGYVHNSRLKPVSDFPYISEGKEGTNTISFEGMGISVVITTQKFDPKRHTIVRKKREGYHEYVIDGVKAEGIDDFLPTDEYKSIEVTIHGKKIAIPQSAYQGVFQVTTYKDNNAVYYDKEADAIYITADNGDGANGYYVCWQIIKGVYKTKEIGYFN